MITETMKKNLEMLIVDDREENRNAARAFFETQPDLQVEYASDYEQAMKMLNEKIYDCAILDVELPKKQGEPVERLGTALGKEAEDLAVPFVYLTAGTYQHGGTFSCALIYLDDFCLEHNSGTRTEEKTNPEAWKEAYEKLKSLYGYPEMLRKSKERHLRATGRAYRESQSRLYKERQEASK